MKQKMLSGLRNVMVASTFFVIFIVCRAGHDLMSLSFDTLYPRSDFNRVEVACKELWSDLDLLVNNHALYVEWMHESDYVVDQFLLIEKNLERLTDFQENGFLREDIQYLANILDILENKIRELAPDSTEGQTQAICCIDYLLSRSKEHIKELYCQNKEVVI